MVGCTKYMMLIIALYVNIAIKWNKIWKNMKEFRLMSKTDTKRSQHAFTTVRIFSPTTFDSLKCLWRWNGLKYTFDAKEKLRLGKQQKKVYRDWSNLIYRYTIIHITYTAVYAYIHNIHFWLFLIFSSFSKTLVALVN